MYSRMALLDSNNTVVNVIVGDPENYTAPEGLAAVADPDGVAEIGGSYAGGAFSAAPPPPPPPPKGPSDYPLSDRQLRIGLIMAGFSLSNIQAAVDAIPDATQRAVAQVWWDRSILIHWEHPMTQNLIGLVGLTPEQASAMWMAAKDLEA